MEKSYCFPPILLLRKVESKKVDEEELRRTARIIQETLVSFGVKVVIANICVGTRFTRYEIQPETGVRIRDIINRENDIKLATGSRYIHIEAPISGKTSIGIDVSDNENPIVTLREMIETKEFMELPSGLICTVGKDIVGKPVIIDLSEMPHLLIGGATGSGKTVFLNSMIMSILYKASPDDVKMLMIDTKGISLTIYNGIPHMLIPVVTDARKSLGALNWCLAEIQERYRKFAEYGARDLKGYNNRCNAGGKLPQILVIVDDLSDLMMICKSEAEESIAQIAQSSRVVGIHLVISTQRPSTDVVAGLIKSNIPSRIAFSVFSAIDSKVILEEKGAEELFGNGDMFFKPQGCKNLIRIQGTYVTDKEISDVVEFLRAQTEHMEECQEKKIETFKIKDSGDRDILFKESGKFCYKTR